MEDKVQYVFKVGDKVRVKPIDNPIWEGREAPINYMCGNIYPIEKVGEDGNYNIEGVGYLQDELEFICSKDVELCASSPDNPLKLIPTEEAIARLRESLEAVSPAEERYVNSISNFVGSAKALTYEDAGILTSDEIDGLIDDAEDMDNSVVKQPEPKGFMVFVESQSKPKHIHKTYEDAEKEAQRLARQNANIGSKVYILEVVKAIKGVVVVEDVEL